MGARFERLAAGSVDRDDRLFELSWPARGDCADASDKVRIPSSCGPLWVQELAGGAFRLVRGFRRFETLLHAGETSFPALVFATDCSAPDLYRARLSGRREEISAVEAARALARLEAAAAPDESTLAALLPLMDQPGGPKALHALRSLKALEEPLARWCSQQKAPLAECASLAALTGESQRGLLVLLRAVNPGGNVLRRWLGLLTGIALRQGCPVEKVLDDSRIQEVLLDSQTARSAGRELITRRLTELRYPETAIMRQRFDGTVKKLGLPGGIKIEPPESFEGGAARASFEFSSPAELRYAAEELGRAAESPEAGELLRCLGAPGEGNE